jgi:hypothetical protein
MPCSDDNRFLTLSESIVGVKCCGSANLEVYKMKFDDTYLSLASIAFTFDLFPTPFRKSSNVI